MDVKLSMGQVRGTVVGFLASFGEVQGATL